MVASAELRRDVRQREVGELPRQGHGHLPWPGDGAHAGSRQHVGVLDVVVRLHQRLDVLDGDVAGALGEQVAQREPHQFHGHRRVLEVRPGDDALQGAGELAHVGADAFGDVQRHVHRNVHALGLALVHQDRGAGLHLRQIHFRRHAADHPRAQTVFEAAYLLRIAVRRRHHLLAGLEQCIENVEELLLEPGSAVEELDVVDHQHVHRAVAQRRLLHVAAAHAGDDLVAEALARQIDDVHLRRPGEDLVADGVHQMGLAQADAAVEQQRVVAAQRHPRRAGALLGHMLRCRLRHLVRLAGHERVEEVLLVEGVRTRRARRLLRRAVFRPRPMRAGALRAASVRRPVASDDAHLDFAHLAAAHRQFLDARQVEGLHRVLGVAVERPQHQLAVAGLRPQRPKPLVELLRRQLFAQPLQNNLPNVIFPLLSLPIPSVVPHRFPARFKC